MNIIGIETSCDETAAAVVKDGREVLSNVVYTQIPLHQPYGGVVPEIASRAHIEKITQVVGDAMKGQPVDAVAVTYGPGLAPALIVGLNAAKGLAKSLGVPLIGINHIEAHLHSPFIYDSPDDTAAKLADPREIGPMLGLAVSGGNTVWIDMPEYGKYEVVGETLDDAAGEAFDKAAKLLGLGYPGGLKIDRISAAYRERFPREPLVPFPKGRPRDGVTALAGLPAELCVSFSGLKTALLRHVQHNPSLVESKEGAQDFGGYDVTSEVAHVVASYQEAIVRLLQGVCPRRRRFAQQPRPRRLDQSLLRGTCAASDGEAEVHGRQRRDGGGSRVLPAKRLWRRGLSRRRLPLAPSRPRIAGSEWRVVYFLYMYNF